MSDSASLATTPRSARAIALCLLATIAFTALDLGSKSWALDNLSVERSASPGPVCQPNEQGYILRQRAQADPVVLVEGMMELRYAENCGAAFGLLREAPGWVRHLVFGAAAIIAALALLLLFAQGKGGRYFAWSVPLIVSGALGNLADRFRLGYVVDFIRVFWEGEIFGLREWPTFNVADITITVGVIFLLLDSYAEGKREREVAEAMSARAAQKKALREEE